MNRAAAVSPLALLGAWTFLRSIDDRLAGTQLRVEGRAELAREGNRIRWSETGMMHREGASTPVFRTLFIEPRGGDATHPNGLLPKGDGAPARDERSAERWFVTFADGRDFHPWTTLDAVDHPCGTDAYRGRIRVGASLDSWSVHWTATGPAKDYSMDTRLTRELTA